MKVYVAYVDYGLEGKSEPLRVFATEALADAWITGATDSYGHGATVVELEVTGCTDNA